MKAFNLTAFGIVLILLGTLGFLATAIISFTVYAGMDHGALAATSFLIIMLGVAFAFPSMLQDTNGGVSTMRMITFAVVVLFCTIYFKIGWSVSKFEEFTIDKTWIYILGLAFGSKVFQRYGEENDANSTETKKKITQVEVTQKVESPGEETGKNTSEDVSK